MTYFKESDMLSFTNRPHTCERVLSYFLSVHGEKMKTESMMMNFHFPSYSVFFFLTKRNKIKQCHTSALIHTHVKTHSVFAYHSPE